MTCVQSYVGVVSEDSHRCAKKNHNCAYGQTLSVLWETICGDDINKFSPSAPLEFHFTNL